MIATGGYGVVRHPMYAAAVPLLVGMPLWLESYAAALLPGVPIGMLALRILIEEPFLRRELKGYVAYTEKVRHRRSLRRTWGDQRILRVDASSQIAVPTRGGGTAAFSGSGVKSSPGLINRSISNLYCLS